MNNIKDKKAPPLSVIVLNFDGLEHLPICFDSLLKTRYKNIEVIFVDNGSKDGSVGYVREKVKRKFEGEGRTLKIIENQRNLGCEGNNVGLRLAEGKYIAFLNNDTMVDPDWISELVKVMEADQSVGVVQPKLLKLRDPEKVDGLGGYVDFIGYAHTLRNTEEANDEQEIFYAEGAAIVVRRKILNNFPDSQKPFDPDYFFLWEDIDFCWLVRLSGYKVFLVPKSIVYHKRGATSAQARLPPHSIFLNSRNRIMTLIKNYSLKNLAFFLPICIIFELAKVVVLLRRRSDHAIATIRGITWNIKNFRYVWRKHLKVQLFTRRVPDSHIFRYMLRPNIIRIYRDFQRHYGS